MSAGLADKVEQYEDLLAEALDVTEIEKAAADPVDDAEACLEMAEAYFEDGRHFRSEGDLPNALAAYAYGHGWLDAGTRLGLLRGPEVDFRPE